MRPLISCWPIGPWSPISAVFDKAEAQLHQRWVSLRNQLGLPHLITSDAIEQVAAFAEAELGALVLHGGVGLNTGLPLTDNQKARQQQIKDSDKKRAAALRNSQQQQQQQPTPTPPAAGTDLVAAVKYTSTVSSWATPCRAWTERGVCQRWGELLVCTPWISGFRESLHHLWVR